MYVVRKVVLVSARKEMEKQIQKEIERMKIRIRC